MDILFATSNPHKVVEAQAVAKEYGINISQLNLIYPEVRAETVSKVAQEGVKYVYKQLSRPVIVEDSGLFIEALGGFPGPYSAYVYKKIGSEGILDLLAQKDNRRAIFRSAFGYCDRRGERVFEGEVCGEITKELLGATGFGYDPIFKPLDCDCTFAQDSKLKDRVSHRRNALDALCKHLNSQH